MRFEFHVSRASTFKNASSRRTAAHCVESIRMKRVGVAPTLVSTQSWNVVCSFPHKTTITTSSWQTPCCQLWYWWPRSADSVHVIALVSLAFSTADMCLLFPLPLLISSVIIYFHEHKMQYKIAGMAGSFWVRTCPFLSPPSTQHHHGCRASCYQQVRGCRLWWAAQSRCLRGTTRSQILAIFNSLRFLDSWRLPTEACKLVDLSLLVLGLLFSSAVRGPISAQAENIWDRGSLCFSWAQA